MANFFGNAGTDSLIGTAGNDTLYGGAGDDYISAGDGNDVIVGGSGADWMEGGKGGDTFTFFSGDLVKLGGGNARIDVIADFTGAGVAGGDNLIFYGYGKTAQLNFRAFSFNGSVEDQTKQYYDVVDQFGTYQGSVMILMADGSTNKLVAGVDYFFGN